MSNQKSIIGCGYIPLEMQAVCLKTNMNTNLGDIVYKFNLSKIVYIMI